MKITYLWMLFILLILLCCQSYYEKEQLNKGKSVAAFLAYYHDIDMGPGEARWLNPVVTTYNITLNELNILPAYAPINYGKGK